MRSIIIKEYINNKFKQKYIREMSTISENFTRNIFNKSDDLERYYNKDVCNFTLSEIKNLLLTLNSTSVEYLRVVTSVLRKYTEFMMINNMSIDNLNHYDLVDTNVLMSCVNKQVIENKYISREQLLSYINNLPNPSDAWCMLAIYEGIKGDNFSNVTLSKGIFDYDNETIQLYDGSVFKPSRELFNIAVDSYETYEYEGLRNLGSNNMRLMGDEIFKVRDNVMFDYDDKKKSYNRLLARIRLIKNYLDVSVISIPRIQISGMVYQFKCIMERENKTYDELFYTPEFLEIRKKFGYEKYVKSRLWSTIKDYLK